MKPKLQLRWEHPSETQDALQVGALSPSKEGVLNYLFISESFHQLPIPLHWGPILQHITLWETRHMPTVVSFYLCSICFGISYEPWGHANQDRELIWPYGDIVSAMLFLPFYLFLMDPYTFFYPLFPPKNKVHTLSSGLCFPSTADLPPSSPTLQLLPRPPLYPFTPNTFKVNFKKLGTLDSFN